MTRSALVMLEEAHAALIKYRALSARAFEALEILNEDPEGMSGANDDAFELRDQIFGELAELHRPPTKD